MTNSATEAERALKPCPFCGGAARIESNRDWHRLYAAHSEDCVFDADDHNLMFPAQPGYLIEIAEVWNERAIPLAAAEPVAWIGPHANAWVALDETRKAVADIIGADPATWPDHGNAPLAIAAVIAIRQNAVERHAAPDRAPSTQPAMCDDGGECGAGGYCITCPHVPARSTDSATERNAARYCYLRDQGEIEDACIDRQIAAMKGEG